MRLPWTPVAKKAVLLLLALVLLLPAVLMPATLLADDPLEGLNEDEKAYVGKVRQSYAEARGALATLQGKVQAAVDAQVGGALDKFFGGEPTAQAGPGTTEILGAMGACNSALASTAATLRQTPPTSMQSLANANAGTAAVLETALQPCNAMVLHEGGRRALQAGASALAWLMGAEAPESKGTSTATKAAIASCISKQCAKATAAIDASEAALNAQVEGVQLEREKESEDFLTSFLFDDCFIATAAYGTSSAVEIDVLRDFRDDVMLASRAGRDYVGFYYAASPTIADFIARHECLRTVVRECVIDPIVDVVDWTSDFWSNT